MVWVFCWINAKNLVDDIDRSMVWVLRPFGIAWWTHEAIRKWLFWTSRVKPKNMASSSFIMKKLFIKRFSKQIQLYQKNCFTKYFKRSWTYAKQGLGWPLVQSSSAGDKYLSSSNLCLTFLKFMGGLFITSEV